MDSANASIRQQLTRTLSGSVSGGYAQNDVLASAVAGANNGHTWSGTASVQQQFGQHLNVQLGYTRLHQVYSGVAVLATTPNTNREFVSISYQFSRPLGR
jgi:aerobic-type carbon monoxide dehydrogenase small subunit (CoxS/CutS family)